MNVHVYSIWHCSQVVYKWVKDLNCFSCSSTVDGGRCLEKENITQVFNHYEIYLTIVVKIWHSLFSCNIGWLNECTCVQYMTLQPGGIYMSEGPKLHQLLFNSRWGKVPGEGKQYTSIQPLWKIFNHSG